MASKLERIAERFIMGILALVVVGIISGAAIRCSDDSPTNSTEIVICERQHCDELPACDKKHCDDKKHGHGHGGDDE